VACSNVSLDKISTVHIQHLNQSVGSRLGYFARLEPSTGTLQSRRQRVSPLTISDVRRRPEPNRSSHVGLASGMAVPGGRNGMEDDDDIVEVAEAFGGGASDDEEVPPHLRALAEAAQSGDAAALLAALGTSLISLSASRSSLVGKLVGYWVLRDLD
jgi:hypothetical protein